MNTKIKLFVEGKADHKFLKDYISYLFNIDLQKKDIIVLGGCGKAEFRDRKIDFEQSTDMNLTNLLFIDADDDFQKQKAQILKIKATLGIEFDLFLMPNNQDVGNLETLLEQLILPKHQGILDCFSAYENCLKQENKGYNLPAQKAKMYAYLNVLLSKNKAKSAREENRDYKNEAHWRLDVAYLEPLKAFLERYFLV